jgi:hypothetical protein
MTSKPPFLSTKRSVWVLAPRCGGVIPQRRRYLPGTRQVRGEALDMYTKSLEIKTRILGGDSHLDVATSKYNLAG